MEDHPLHVQQDQRRTTNRMTQPAKRCTGRTDSRFPGDNAPVGDRPGTAHFRCLLVIEWLRGTHPAGGWLRCWSISARVALHTCGSRGMANRPHSYRRRQRNRVLPSCRVGRAMNATVGVAVATKCRTASADRQGLLARAGRPWGCRTRGMPGGHRYRVGRRAPSQARPSVMATAFPAIACRAPKTSNVTGGCS